MFYSVAFWFGLIINMLEKKLMKPRAGKTLGKWFFLLFFLFFSFFFNIYFFANCDNLIFVIFIFVLQRKYFSKINNKRQLNDARWCRIIISIKMQLLFMKFFNDIKLIFIFIFLRYYIYIFCCLTKKCRYLKL